MKVFNAPCSRRAGGCLSVAYHIERRHEELQGSQCRRPRRLSTPPAMSNAVLNSDVNFSAWSEDLRICDYGDVRLISRIRFWCCIKRCLPQVWAVLNELLRVVQMGLMTSKKGLARTTEILSWNVLVLHCCHYFCGKCQFSLNNC